MNTRMLIAITKYSVLEAIRDRFLLFVIIGVEIIFGLSLFVGELAITEASEIQTAILGSSFRLFTVFTISLFVINSMLREFNDKGFELILSHPVPRWVYYLAKLSGFMVVALIVVSLVICNLIIYVPFSNLIFWSISLLCEISIVISLSLAALYSFNNVTISFSLVFSFYLLARTIESILLISSSPIVATTSLSHKFIDWMIASIAYILPGLYQFTQTDWLVYGFSSYSELVNVIGQTVIYVLFLSSIAIYDLYRKEL